MSSSTSPLPREADDAMVMGVDLGTGGARAVIASAAGDILATSHAELGAVAAAPSAEQDGWHEQDPEAWWAAARSAIGGALRQAGGAEGTAANLRGVSVDGTSGTVVGVDFDGTATMPGLMYNDSRAGEEALELDASAREHGYSGARITASFGIAKMLWASRRMPEELATTRTLAHQADFVAGRLTGRFGTTDYSNALKSGFDLVAGSWPGWIDQYPEVRSRLPGVVAPGTVRGRVTAIAAEETGLPVGLAVVAGATDGTVAFLASGAARVGDDNTTLGTTLVFKRVAARYIEDAEGLLYCHKLPGGSWLPGAASNVGADWIRRDFAGADLAELDAAARALLPTPLLAYPLTKRGERFPFNSDAAVGFCEPEADDPVAGYAARLQGTAFVERLGYEVLDEATGADDVIPSGAVYATGGGSRSDVWMQLRADVCGRTYHRPSRHESAFGSAILAAAGTVHRNLREASNAMIGIAATFHPDRARHEAFTDLYRRFLGLLRERGFLREPR